MGSCVSNKICYVDLCEDNEASTYDLLIQTDPNNPNNPTNPTTQQTQQPKRSKRSKQPTKCDLLKLAKLEHNNNHKIL